MPPLPSEATATLALVQAHTSTTTTILERVLAAIRDLIAEFTGWYDEVAVARIAREIEKQIAEGRLVTAEYADAFLAEVTTIMGKPKRPVGATRLDITRVAPIDSSIGTQYRYRRSTGSDDATARASALARVEQVAETSITEAKTTQASDFFAKNRVARYRRVIHPEASRGGVCGLCITAATRIYRSGSLRPLHNRCHCETLPYIGPLDVGAILNASDMQGINLVDLYASAGSNRAEDLTKVRYQPGSGGALTAAADPANKQRAPKTSGGSGRRDADAALRAQLDALESNLRIMRAKHDPALAEPIHWHEARIAELRKQLAA